MIKETNWNEPRHDKTNKMSVRPAKTQISLGIRPVWSESLLCTQWVAKDPSFLHVDSEDSDQTGRMSRLIWVFAGRTATLLVFVMARLKWDHSIPVLHSLSSCIIRNMVPLKAFTVYVVVNCRTCQTNQAKLWQVRQLFHLYQTVCLT